MQFAVVLALAVVAAVSATNYEIQAHSSLIQPAEIQAINNKPSSYAPFETRIKMKLLSSLAGDLVQFTVDKFELYADSDNSQYAVYHGYLTTSKSKSEVIQLLEESEDTTLFHLVEISEAPMFTTMGPMNGTSSGSNSTGFPINSTAHPGFNNGTAMPGTNYTMSPSNSTQYPMYSTTPAGGNGNSTMNSGNFTIGTTSMPSNSTGPCKNGATYYNGFCICIQGYYGPYCGHHISGTTSGFMNFTTQSPTDVPSPCVNGNRTEFGQCQCFSNYQGISCDQPICQNGGSSLNGQCFCPNGFYGKFCTRHSQKPARALKLVTPKCKNGGTPIFGMCICPEGFYGPICGHHISSTTTASPVTIVPVTTTQSSHPMGKLTAKLQAAKKKTIDMGARFL